MKNDTDVVYQNKDIATKTFTEMFPNDALEACGLDLPRIKQILPTNLPAIRANELRLDNIFELEDDSLAIIDYESSYKKKNKLKYLDYVIRTLDHYWYRPNLKIRMIVLYTADVTPKQTKSNYDSGAVSIKTEEAFLSELDSDEIKNRLTEKIRNHEKFTDKELMEFVILPLTCRGKMKKRDMLEELFTNVKNIQDEKTQIFLLSGMMVFSDKIIDSEMAKQMKGWIMMTKVARLFEEEKLAAVKQAVEAAKEAAVEAAKETAKKTAAEFLKNGVAFEIVKKCSKDLSKDELDDIYQDYLRETAVKKDEGML